MTIPSETSILSYYNIYTLIGQFIKTIVNRMQIKINTCTANGYNYYERYD